MIEHQDLKYKTFLEKLIPTKNPNEMLGVRMGVLRKLVKSTPLSFLDERHKYHEENVLHVLMINEMTDFEDCLARVNDFLPVLDNWAVVDVFYPKVLTKDKTRLFGELEKWLKSEHEYIVRFGLNYLRVYYLEEGLDLVSEIRHQGYYVKMMQAWLVCDGFVKHWDKALSILKNQQLDLWVHNKSIQKGVESLRLSEREKEILKSFRQKRI